MKLGCETLCFEVLFDEIKKLFLTMIDVVLVA